MNALSPSPSKETAGSAAPVPPLALLAELTHRCPLQCPYCSNPVELERSGAELDTDTWKRVLSEAVGLGVLQVHFSGGEPTVRKDLVELVRHASSLGCYTNLITSGVLLDGARLQDLYDAGTGPCSAQLPGHRCRKRRADRQLQRRAGAQTGACPAGPRVGTAADG